MKTMFGRYIDTKYISISFMVPFYPGRAIFVNTKSFFLRSRSTYVVAAGSDFD